MLSSQEFFGQTIGNPDFDWNFVTTPQVALNNSVVPQPRGKMLGGSTGLNFMAWVRASAAEYDAWEKVECLSIPHPSLLMNICMAARGYGMELGLVASLLQKD